MESGIDPAENYFFGEIESFLARRKKNDLSIRRAERICAVDAAYNDHEVTAVATLFHPGGAKAVEYSSYHGVATFPYKPGLFYLREGPAAVQAVRQLRERPDVVCFDAHGKAHPRWTGLATICGTILGIPSIGVAKKLLVGEIESGRGPFDKILVQGRAVGFVPRCSPRRFWSPGFSVSLKDLELLITVHGRTCLSALVEADALAKREMVRWRNRNPNLR